MIALLRYAKTYALIRLHGYKISQSTGIATALPQCEGRAATRVQLTRNAHTAAAVVLGCSYTARTHALQAGLEHIRAHPPRGADGSRTHRARSPRATFWRAPSTYEG